VRQRRGEGMPGLMAADPTKHGVLLSIQALRALAALAVVASHVQLDLRTRLEQPKALPYFDLGTAGVDLFFVISGFVMVYASTSLFQTENGPRVFYVRRLIRIVPLYWACTTIYLLFPIIAPSIARTTYPLDLSLASFLFIPYPYPDTGGMFPVVGQGWTLNYEMLFYSVFAFAVALPRRQAVAAVAVVFTAAALLGFLINLPQPLGFWTRPIILEFVLGACLGLLYVEGVRIGFGLRIVFVVGGLSAWGILEVYGPSEPLITRGVPAAMLLVGSAFGAQRKTTSAGRILVIAGNASYALYLFHPIFIRAFREVAIRLGMEGEMAQWMYLSITLVAATLGAIAIHYAFELPITQMLRRTVETPTRKVLHLRSALPEISGSGVSPRTKPE
jgi:exopolysaccharide production protein ExoZ